MTIDALQAKSISRVAHAIARCVASGGGKDELRRLVHRSSANPSAAPGLGAAFGILARFDEELAREMEAIVFDGPAGPSAWDAWLIWSNPVFPAAGLLMARYEAHIEGLKGAPIDGSLPPPLAPPTRCGLHLLLISCFVPGRAPEAESLARRFLLNAPAASATAALNAVRLAISAGDLR